MDSLDVNVTTGDYTLKSVKPCDLSNCTKEDIKNYFENSYNLYESLFTALKDKTAFYKCPDRLRLPLIFYYGHTAAVYINKLILGDLLQPSEHVNLHFETVFETGVDEMSWDDTKNYRMGGAITWPALVDVVEYRLRVRELVLKVIDETPLELPVTYDSTWWPVLMGIEHERIHLETSSVLIRQLPVDMVERPQGWNYGPTSTGDPVLKNRMIHVGETAVTLGKPRDLPTYGWDNEYGRLDCKVPAFEASEYLITNREFLAFIQDGGYTDKTLWTEEGWHWREYRKVKHPPFWTCGGDCKSACGGDLVSYSHCKAAGGWIIGTNGHTNGDEDDHESDSYRLRVMFDVIPMPWDWPAVINYHEAKAFCAWKGPNYRLPCEAEKNVIRGTQRVAYEDLSHDISSQSEMTANIDLSYGSSTPVNLLPANDRGFYDASGNVWEWMEDDFNGLPGATTSIFYEDYSSPYYDGLHTIILGGSWVTTGNATSQFYRSWFRRHFLQHAGFRVVRSVMSSVPLQVPICHIHHEEHVQGTGRQKNPWTLPESVRCEAVRTSSTQLQQDTKDTLDAQLHEDWLLEHPPTLHIVDMALTTAERYLTEPGGRCLYLGCGTGRGAGPLTVLFDKVLAVDFSGHYIDSCLKLQSEGIVTLPDGTAMVVPNHQLSKVTFKQLNWLPNEVGSFHLVLSTLLDRVTNYKAWLIRMKEVVKSDGLLIITSQLYEAHTLQEALKLSFTLLETKDLPITTNVQDVTKMTVWRHN